MKRHIPLKQSSAGFTLLEMLVVVIIIGVLAAIAAPGWLTFMNRQRLGRSSEQIVQALRTAQAEAKRTSTYREVRFDNNSDQPRYAVLPAETSFDATSAILNIKPVTGTVSNWQTFGQGEIRSGILELKVIKNNAAATTSGSIIFGPKGEVVRQNLAPSNPATTTTPLLIVKMSLKNSSTTRRCVQVMTLLGAINQADDNTNCPP